MSDHTPTEPGHEAGDPAPNSPEAIEADIERQREDLAATVTELQSRLDVKAKAQAKAGEIKDAATTDAGRPRPELIAGAVLAAAVVVALIVWRVRARRG